MKDEKPFRDLPLGLLELDSSGKVVYFSPARETPTDSQTLNLVGCNLLKDVEPISQVKEFHDRFHVFLKNPLPVEIFNLAFPCPDASVRAQVMLARVNQSADGHHDATPDGRKLVLVLIRRS